jgi:hypothetical protein
MPFYCKFSANLKYPLENWLTIGRDMTSLSSFRPSHQRFPAQIGHFNLICSDYERDAMKNRSARIQPPPQKLQMRQPAGRRIRAPQGI